MVVSKEVVDQKVIQVDVEKCRYSILGSSLSMRSESGHVMEWGGLCCKHFWYSCRDESIK